MNITEDKKDIIRETLGTSMSNPLKAILRTIDNAAISEVQFGTPNVLPNPARILVVYLFGSPTKSRRELWRKPLIHPFISQHIEIDFEKPLFVEKQQAQNYGRFLPNAYCIKAYVYDCAIVSKGNQLYLHSHYFKRTMIHGFYTSSQDFKRYIKNPEFDNSLITKTTELNTAN